MSLPFILSLSLQKSSQPSTLNLLRSYTWGLDIAGSLTATGGVGALLQIVDHTSGRSYFPTYDGNGNIASLINAVSGAIAAAYEYSPFGELLRAASYDDVIADNPFRFSTKFTDSETGLVYYGHRYYAPGLGRFINRDPIEEGGGLNLYGFAGNDGINGVDYMGYSGFGSFLKKWWKPIVAVIVSVVTYGAASGWAAGWVAAAGLTGTTGAVAAGAIAGAISGFAGGAVGAALNGGDMSSILEGGLMGAGIGAVTGAIGGYLDAPGDYDSKGFATPAHMKDILAHSPRYAADDSFFSNGITLAHYGGPSAWTRFVNSVSSRGVWGAAAGGGLSYIAGLGSGAWGAAKGTATAIAHPILAIQGAANGLGTLVGRAIYDTAGLASDIGNGLYQTVMDPSRLGYAVGNVVGGVGIGMGINGVATLGARAFVAEGSAARYLSQGFSAEQAEYLAQPYGGMGHHLLRREWGFPTWLTESSVDSGAGLTRGQFYEYHFKVDPTFYGTRLPASAGGGTWSGAELGLSKYWWTGRSGYFGTGGAVAGARQEGGLLYGW